MLPVLFSLGPLSISSFGLFLALAFSVGTFLVWRISRAWDLPEEKVLDLIILTFFGGLIGSRALFVVINWEAFSGDFFKAFLVTKYPGLSFWGGLIGGFLSLFVFCRRLRLNFWQMADIASIGLLGGLILGNIGCFLGGCIVGVPSNLFLATPVVGVLGKRFPVALLEAIIVLFLLRRVWPIALRFHFHGKIVSMVAIFLGTVKFLMEFLKSGSLGSQLLSLILLALGLVLFYKLSNRSLKKDLISLRSTSRRAAIAAFRKEWYNFRIGLSWKINKWKLSKILRRLHVKPTPKDI